jgi:hypothetical protein
MPEYVLIHPTDDDDLEDVLEKVQAAGAEFRKAVSRVILVEANAAALKRLRAALPGWVITPHRKTVRVPERMPGMRGGRMPNR